MKDAILYVGLCQSIFAALILATKRRVSTADIILVICLVSIALRFLAKILTLDQEIHSDFTVGIIPLTLGPFIYLYTKYLTTGNPKFNKKDLLHFAPFILFLFVYQIVFKGQISFNEEEFLINDEFLAVRILFAIVFFTTVLVYTILTYQLLYKYLKEVRAKKDETEDGFTLIWLTLIITLFNSLFLAYFSLGLVNTLSFSARFDLVFISSIGLVVMAYAISYFGIRQPSILEDYFYVFSAFTGIKDSGNRRKVENGIRNDNVLVKTKSDSKEKGVEVEIIVDRLNSHMNVEKPYLKSELTLAELSQSLKITKSQLTHILNNHLGMNFFSYINNYRLKEVLKKLDDPSNNHLTILSIAFDCGFNSKSTFNSIFKQATGNTPSEYRRRNLEASE